MDAVKYNYGDVVSFKMTIGTDEFILTGKVYIIDKYGTFEQSEEPSYDIMVDNYNGAPCLFKHIRQSGVFTLSRWEINCDGYYPYCKLCRFEPDRGDVIKNGLSYICPKCGAEMVNADDLNKHVK